jgi:transcription initiation factor TFIID subunit 11
MCDAEQAKRYDAFVVASIPKSAVTKVRRTGSFNFRITLIFQLNRDLFDQPVKDDFASIIGGLGKIFVAEVVEIGKLPSLA